MKGKQTRKIIKVTIVTEEEEKKIQQNLSKVKEVNGTLNDDIITNYMIQ